MKVEQMNWNAEGTVKALRFWCPGCKEHHAAVEGRWSFNGDYEKPTFSPSLLVRGTKITDKGWQELREWKAAGSPVQQLGGKQLDSVTTVCHSFVTDGRIQYLSDCTHSLAGQTVDMADMDD